MCDLCTEPGSEGAHFPRALSFWNTSLAGSHNLMSGVPLPGAGPHAGQPEVGQMPHSSRQPLCYNIPPPVECLSADPLPILMWLLLYILGCRESVLQLVLMCWWEELSPSSSCSVILTSPPSSDIVIYSLYNKSPETITAERPVNHSL